MKTIAQTLNVNNFPFIIKDDNGNKIYYEDSDGGWWKSEYDDKGNEIYCEYSDGDWLKREHDNSSNVIYYENSNGTILDNKLKKVELTMDEIADKFNINVNNLTIKKGE